MDLLLSKGGGKEVGNAHLFWDRISDGEGMNLALAPAFAGASHGTKRLTDAEIERAYGRCRKKHPGKCSHSSLRVDFECAHIRYNT